VKANRLSPWFIFSEAVAKYPSHRAIWYQGQVLTYAELHDQAVQLAQWMLSEGVRPGELVGMYMTNRPEFMVIWLAALCIGCAPAFINYHLEGRGLLHSLDVCASKLLFVDENPECQARIEESKAIIEHSGTRVVVFDGLLRLKIAAAARSPPGDEYRLNVKPEFPICLCYTRYIPMTAADRPLLLLSH
jgi:acyl-CoA synthetase (AMP-forming)/AMP-acid ligase II